MNQWTVDADNTDAIIDLFERDGVLVMVHKWGRFPTAVKDGVLARDVHYVDVSIGGPWDGGTQICTDASVEVLRGSMATEIAKVVAPGNLDRAALLASAMHFIDRAVAVAKAGL